MLLKNRKQFGFTLIELLIVIGIIGILAGITVNILNPVQLRNRAKDGVLLSAFNKMKLGIEGYFKYYGEYPDNTVCTECYPNQCPTTNNSACTIINELPGAQMYAVLPGASTLMRVWFTVTDVPAITGLYAWGNPGVFRYHQPGDAEGGTCLAVATFSSNSVYLWKPDISNRTLLCNNLNPGNANMGGAAFVACRTVTPANLQGCTEL